MRFPGSMSGERSCRRTLDDFWSGSETVEEHLSSFSAQELVDLQWAVASQPLREKALEVPWKPWPGDGTCAFSPVGLLERMPSPKHLAGPYAPLMRLGPT